MTTENPAAERTLAIREKALELGFDAVGVAPAGPADPEGRFRAWLERGFHGGMGYMMRTTKERADPRELVPNARSVIALALSYYFAEQDRGPAAAKVSRYARGADYHAILRRKARKLRKFILTLEPNARVHPAVDTSPVLERAWAARAGIAWVGKSTMAISPHLGTYTFLAALVTDVDLIPDAPHADRCGSCTACLEACPTGALIAPYELDARRCITYWNVEHRDWLGPEAPPLHGWLAGCDLCQEVCPWNKFARPCREPRLLPRPALAHPDLDAFAHDTEHVERAIAGTALARTGASAIARNALRILVDGGSGSRQSRPDQASDLGLRASDWWGCTRS